MTAYTIQKLENGTWRNVGNVDPVNRRALFSLARRLRAGEIEPVENGIRLIPCALPEFTKRARQSNMSTRFSNPA
jgi:hypothetical protein